MFYNYLWLTYYETEDINNSSLALITAYMDLFISIYDTTPVWYAVRNFYTLDRLLNVNFHTP